MKSQLRASGSIESQDCRLNYSTGMLAVIKYTRTAGKNGRFINTEKYTKYKVKVKRQKYVQIKYKEIQNTNYIKQQQEEMAVNGSETPKISFSTKKER